jgi:hypothetical protein
MYLIECVKFTASSINNTIISLIDKCSYFSKNTTITKCFINKYYMYNRCCNISKTSCECIQNNVIYNTYNNNNNNTIKDIKYIYIIMFISILIICCNATCKYIYRNRNRNRNNIDNNTLPKYNEIDKNNNNKQIIIVEIPPPKYIEID